MSSINFVIVTKLRWQFPQLKLSQDHFTSPCSALKDFMLSNDIIAKIFTLKTFVMCTADKYLFEKDLLLVQISLTSDINVNILFSVQTLKKALRF